MRQVCSSLHPPLHAAHELASLFIRGFLQCLCITSSISVNFTEVRSFPTQHKKVTLEVVSLDFKYKASHISPSSSIFSFIVLKASVIQFTIKCLLLCNLLFCPICIICIIHSCPHSNNIGSIFRTCTYRNP